MGINAVIFDMDGTLVDAKEWHYEALNEALAIFGYGISRDDHLNRFDGLPTAKKLEILRDEKGFPEILFPLVSVIKQERTLRFIAKDCFPRVEQLLMFQWLRDKGIKVAVATNSIRLTAERMLSSAGILEALDELITNEDVSSPKPSPEIYLRATERLGISPEECLVIEDNDYGVSSAMSAGCQVIRVSRVEEVRIALFEPYLNGSGV